MAKPLSFKDMINAEPRPGEDDSINYKVQKKEKERMRATKKLNPKTKHYPYNNA